MEAPFAFTLSDDTTRLHVEAAVQIAVLSANVVEESAMALAGWREKMQPPVPNDPPMLEALLAQADPRFFVSPQPMLGGVVLSIRHPGFGWLHFQIPTTQVLKLAELLTAHNAGSDAQSTSN